MASDEFAGLIRRSSRCKLLDTLVATLRHAMSRPTPGLRPLTRFEWLRLLSAPSACIMLCIGFFVPCIINRPHTPNDLHLEYAELCNTANGYNIMGTIVGIAYTMIIWGALLRLDLLLTCTTESNMNVLLSLARRPSATDIVPVLCFFVLIIGRLSKVFDLEEDDTIPPSMLVSNSVTTVIWFGGMCFTVVVLRVQMIKRHGTHLAEHLEKWFSSLALLTIVQIFCAAFTVHLGVSTQPIRFGNYTCLHTSAPCRLINSTYLATYCQPSFDFRRTTLEYQCFDEGGVCGRPSAYDSCKLQIAATDLTYRGLGPITFCEYVPNFMIISEIRRGIRRTWLTLIADLVALVAVACIAFSSVTIVTPQPITISLQRATLYIVYYACPWLTAVAMVSYVSEALRHGGLKLATGRMDLSEYSGFLSHDWGIDELGRNNHARVQQINEQLQAAGLSTWFDSEQMAGDIHAAMTDGIDQSATVLVFITQNYLIKTSGGGPRGLGDNCLVRMRSRSNLWGASRSIRVWSM